MPEEIKQGHRIRIGPVVADFLNGLDEQTPQSLDAAFKELLDGGAAQGEDQVERLQDQRDDALASVVSLSCALTSVTEALAEWSKASDAVHHLLDHRTKSMTTLLLHISGLIGTHFTQGEDRTRLHARLETLQTEMREQMDVLATLVGKRQIERQSTVQRAVARAEEERLSVQAKEEQAVETRMQRGGQER